MYPLKASSNIAATVLRCSAISKAVIIGAPAPRVRDGWKANATGSQSHEQASALPVKVERILTSAIIMRKKTFTLALLQGGGRHVCMRRAREDWSLEVDVRQSPSVPVNWYCDPQC